jgi:hypothetical protein
MSEGATPLNQLRSITRFLPVLAAVLVGSGMLLLVLGTTAYLSSHRAASVDVSEARSATHESPAPTRPLFGETPAASAQQTQSPSLAPALVTSALVRLESRVASCRITAQRHDPAGPARLLLPVRIQILTNDVRIANPKDQRRGESMWERCVRARLEDEVALDGDVAGQRSFSRTLVLDAQGVRLKGAAP